MAQTQLRPAPLAKVAGPGIAKLTIARNSEDNRPLPEIQCGFLASRFGLSAERARVVASLAFGEARS